jgi:hypothetical protein
MSFDAQRRAWDLIRSKRFDLRPSDRLVLLALADRMNDSGECWPSIESISDDTGLDKSTIITAKNRLIEAGIVDQKKRFGTSPIYRITIPEIQNSENTENCASIPENKNSENAYSSIPETPTQVLRVSGKEPIIEPINKPVIPLKKKRKRLTNPKLTMQEYLDQCRSTGQLAIPSDHKVFEMARRMKIPDEFVHLAWCSFRDRYSGRDDKQASWPLKFKNAVAGNWEKIWWLTPEDEYQLTTVGRQKQIEQRSVA